MLTLLINTATKIESLVLFDGEKIGAQKSWSGNSDETAKLIPHIFAVFKKGRKTLSQLKKIIVVSGPGPFSALRIGVTTANTLAWVLGIPLYTLGTRELLHACFPKNTLPKMQRVLLLHAGGRFVLRNTKGAKEVVLPIQDVIKKQKTMAFFGDITDNEREQLAEHIGKNHQFLPHKKLEKIAHILPLIEKHLRRVAIPPGAGADYLRPPNITKSRHV